MMDGLVAARAEPTTVMIDAAFLKGHRIATSLRVEAADLGRPISPTKACPELVEGAA